MSESKVLNQLDYASSKTDSKYASVRLAKSVFWISCVFTPVGFLILFAYGLFAYEFIEMIGLFWALIGAGGSALVILLSFINFFATFQSPNVAQVRWYYVSAFLLSFITYPSIMLCFRVGSEWDSMPHYRLVVHNDTDVTLNKVIVHFSGGDISVGEVLPRSYTSTRLKWIGHNSGSLDITTVLGSRERRKMDRIYCDNNCLHGPYYDIHIEKAELPK